MKGRRGVQRIESIEVAPEVGLELPRLEDDTLSLEQLGRVYADMLVGKSDVTKSSDPATDSQTQGERHPNQDTGDDPGEETLTSSPSQNEVPITPESIIEALLFVGRPDNIPIAASQMSGMMRGVHEDEIPEIIARLNHRYETQSRVMRIESQGDGYLMRVAAGMERTSNAMQGKLRETRLPQEAIDCLALVAYNPGATRDEIEKLWNRSASNTLGLLVRKELLQVHRETRGRKTITLYRPTDRFLNLIGLSSLQDLPRVDSEF